MEKRYFWLKMKADYLTSPKIKKLRRIAGGDTFTIIYLKMQLLSINNKGIITFEGIENTFEEELALKLDEQLEDVQLTLAYLQTQDLIERNENDFLLPEACENIGSESESAERVRRFREKKEQKALQCNASVTQVKRNSISKYNSNSKYIYILEYWNSKDIIKHKELNEQTEKAIKNALKEFGEEQIKTAIDRYSQVIKDTSYYFDTKWTLCEFLKQRNAMPDFLDNGSKWVNYTQRGGKKVLKQQEYTQHDYDGVFDTFRNMA